jgi:hypothetical protein
MQGVAPGGRVPHSLLVGCFAGDARVAAVPSQVLLFLLLHMRETTTMVSFILKVTSPTATAAMMMRAHTITYTHIAFTFRQRYVGIGWQLNNIPSHYSHLEQYEIEEAKALKAVRPDVRVSVLRNSEVATVFWDSAKAKMYDPTTQDFWTQCNGQPCKGKWDSPAGNTDKVRRARGRTYIYRTH